MSDPVDFPPMPPDVDPTNGAGSAKASVYLTMLASCLAQDDAALTFTLLSTAAAICGAANGQPPEAMVNQFAACLPIGRDLWLDMTAEDQASDGEAA